MFGGFPFEDFFQGQGPGHREIDNTKYYKVLGVNQNMSCGDIKKKYKQLAKKMHPDKGGDPKKFAEINNAAEVLTDPEKRSMYDKYGEEGLGQGMDSHFGGPQDLFDLLAGGGRKAKKNAVRKCKNSSLKVEVSLDEIYHGVKKTVEISRTRNCTECKGMGGSKVNVCSGCRGKGHVNRLVQIGPGMYSQSSGACDECRGSGSSVDPKYRCKKCNGGLVFEEKKKVELCVDKGSPNHSKYPFYGEGNEEPEMKPGDLIVIIQEKEHPVFKRKNADLAMEKRITLKEALTGYKFKIDHFDGPKVITGTPGDIIKPEDIRTIRELGMPLAKTPYKFGNLFIHFEVEFPLFDSLSDAQIKGLEKLLPGVKEKVPREGALKTIPYDKAQITENPTSIHSDYKEDDEEDPRMSGKRTMHCSGTIF